MLVASTRSLCIQLPRVGVDDAEVITNETFKPNVFIDAKLLPVARAIIPNHQPITFTVNAVIVDDAARLVAPFSARSKTKQAG